MVDHAELVWRLLDDYTQEQVGKALGWVRSKVAEHLALQRIASQAWQIIVATFEPKNEEKLDDVATKNVAPATNDNNVSSTLRPRPSPGS